VVAIPAPDLPRVLLVEDEGAVRELLSSALERNGFDVVTAGSAEEALTLASPAFQILLSDISLPGMSGVQLARQLRRSLPSLRVLLMSGYAREEFASGRMRWTICRSFPSRSPPHRGRASCARSSNPPESRSRLRASGVSSLKGHS
jgi:CheY-like chemotaxis protein